jgi:hypothetical protein
LFVGRRQSSHPVDEPEVERERPELGGKSRRAFVVVGDEQRLLAPPVAGEDQPTRALIPDSKGEQSVQLRDEAFSVLL